MFLITMFGDWWRNMSRSPVRHKMEIFLTEFRENWDKRNRSFLKVFGNVNFKMLQRGEFGCSWLRYSAIDGGTCQEAQCAIKWKFLKQNFEKIGKKMVIGVGVVIVAVFVVIFVHIVIIVLYVYGNSCVHRKCCRNCCRWCNNSSECCNNGIYCYTAVCDNEGVVCAIFKLYVLFSSRMSCLQVVCG